MLPPPPTNTSYYFNAKYFYKNKITPFGNHAGTVKVVWYRGEFMGNVRGILLLEVIDWPLELH